ncbi:phBC6A51 family helix-turn-helix protein [Desulfosporosinus sp. BG]|uniref:phBC6A51 family helix-turn-helix protein n=1 Tax=Desulfosporosinus sp. BG TaxID=1633135 RepID=UPI000839FD3F|nr:phBC6A51 family helix-turn-helix protein [Desulfosporosinus sp. BG]ODA41245.1 hypothetical protein DSBG_2016 [Desulfosporosinus sp. BG]
MVAKFKNVDLTKFNDQQRQALEMLCVPNRQEYGEIAKAVGVNLKTLYRWRQFPEFVEAISGMAIMNLHADLPEVFSAMLKKAKAGEVRSVALMFKLLGLTVDKKEVQVEVEAKGESNEDVAEDIKRLKAMLGKR